MIDDLKFYVSKLQAKEALNKIKEEYHFNKFGTSILNLPTRTPIVVHAGKDLELQGKRTFLKLCAYFTACKKGFLVRCRPITSVDG